jgi:hypothetical protein
MSITDPVSTDRAETEMAFTNQLYHSTVAEKSSKQESEKAISAEGKGEGKHSRFSACSIELDV